MRPDWFDIVKHRQMNIGSSRKRRFFVLNQGVHYQSVNLIRMPPARPKFCERYAKFCQMYRFFYGFGDDFFVGLSFQMVHLVMQLADERQKRHFPKDGSVPKTFHRDFQLIAVLLNFHFGRIIMKTFQKIEVG